MTKTVKDYMNDPRILEDSEIMEAPECIREIHAIRLKLQDERAGMTIEEHVAYVNEKAKAFLARSGMRPMTTDFTKQESEPLKKAVSEPILA